MPLIGQNSKVWILGPKMTHLPHFDLNNPVALSVHVKNQKKNDDPILRK